MFEVYYGLPVDIPRESRIEELVKAYQGKLTYREAPEVDGTNYVCLTFEFDALVNAEQASERLRSEGEHVEAIQEYGDD